MFSQETDMPPSERQESRHGEDVQPPPAVRLVRGESELSGTCDDLIVRTLVTRMGGGGCLDETILLLL